MGIISLGIGPPTPNVTFLMTGGLAMPEPVVVPTVTGIVYGPVATGEVFGVSNAT